MTFGKLGWLEGLEGTQITLSLDKDKQKNMLFKNEIRD